MRPSPSFRALWVGIRCGLLGHRWQEFPSYRGLRRRECRRCGVVEIMR